MSSEPGGPGRVAVLGMGNVLLGDDALGPYVVRLLESRYEFDEAVEVLDVGTPGLDLTPFLADARAVVIVDTVHSKAPPGSLRLYRKDEILSTPPPPRTSPHEPGLREALMATELTDCAPPELLLVGVVPASTVTGTGLSEPVRLAVPGAEQAVLDELERLRLPARARAHSLPLQIWWEESVEAGTP